MVVPEGILYALGHLQLRRPMLVAANHRPFQESAWAEDIVHRGLAPASLFCRMPRIIRGVAYGGIIV